MREQQKQERRERIFSAAMSLFESHGFQETTVLAIAKAAKVSRGTVFNYFPYKEAILVEHLAQRLYDMQTRVAEASAEQSPLETIYTVFDELATFIEANRHVVLPLSYELLNPDPERSRQAYTSLPLVPILYVYLSKARNEGLIRGDFSRERLARTLANTYFLTALQWAVYRQDRSVHEELRTALKLALEGMTISEEN